MKITYNWLRDFVDIKMPPQELAGKLTMAGLEVTALEERLGDFVFEIEVTSNRPDWLSVVGIAREVAAITKSPVTSHKSPAQRKKQKIKKQESLTIVIEDKKDCPLYTAKIIRDVKVGPSPDWLKKRLELVGCRSVNNIVDITNYVLFEQGEPLHAFDLDRLASPGAIIIRRAKNNEKITTIDGKELKLDSGILVIADKNKPVAVAGVMGGIDTEVTIATRNILLEAAVFNPVLVRQGRRKLALESESSYRFERGLDPAIVEDASCRAVSLIKELCGGELSVAKSSSALTLEKKSIGLDVERVTEVLGVRLSGTKIKQILNSLGFKVRAKAKAGFMVEPPPGRLDINLDVDLMEEIARIFGYENIPQSLPAVRPQPAQPGKVDVIPMIKDMLTGLGLNEAITHSLIGRGLLKEAGLSAGEGEIIEILNPLSQEQSVLRPTLILSLGRAVALNLNQKQEFINLFEIAKVFSQEKEGVSEELVLGISLSGARPLFLEQGAVKDPVGLLHLKGILEVIFQRLGIEDYNFFNQPEPGQIGVYLGKEKIGLLAQLKSSALEALEIKNKDVFVAEVSLDDILPRVNLNKKFIPLPAYPAITRDISLVLKEEAKVKDMLEAIKAGAGALLWQARVSDCYKGKQIPSGFRGLTISCLYRSPERTLTEEEIKPLHSLICGILSEKFGAQIR